MNDISEKLPSSPLILVTERGPSGVSRKPLDSRLRGNDDPHGLRIGQIRFGI
jgi:hypothetical protein